MTISNKKLPNAIKTFLVYLVKHLFVVLNSVLTIKYILLNATVMNRAAIRVPFGYSYVCTCPIRTELYNRHKI